MIFKLISPTGHKLKFSYLYKKAEYLPDVYLLNSGTSALSFLLSGLKNKTTGKIVIPAYTCPTVATAIIQSGFQPVLCDISLENFDYQVENLERLIESEKPDAIILVNMFGMLEKIPKLNTPVILDNAQGFMESKIPGKYAGQIISFGRGKRINSLAGGMAQIFDFSIFQNLDEAYKKISLLNLKDDLKYLINFILYKFLFLPRLFWVPAQIPQLKIGQTIFEPEVPVRKISKLNRKVIGNIYSDIESIDKMRVDIINSYANTLKQHPAIEKMYVSTKSFRLPILLKSSGLKPVFIRMMADEGISVSGFYPHVLNEQPGLKEIMKDDKIYPNAEKIVQKLVTLPVNEFVTPEVINKLKKGLDSLPLN